MRAIITDLDGTLLRTDKTISEYTLDMMRQCHDRGIAIIAATARPERAILQYHQQICFDAVASLNGARIILPNTVLENGIPHLSGTRILSRLAAIPDTSISIETSDGLYSNTEIPEWDAAYYDGFPDLPVQGTLYKILVSGKDRALYEQVERILTDDTYYTIAEGTLVQIMSTSATKWAGIRTILEAFDIPKAEAVYFGDDNDDIEPIQMCGVGVAVANAIQAVIHQADFVVGSNDEDGVAHFIEASIFPQLER